MVCGDVENRQNKFAHLERRPVPLTKQALPHIHLFMKFSLDFDILRYQYIDKSYQ